MNPDLFTNVEKTRYDEMEQQAIKFHNKNPKVWELFCKFTLELIARGFKHYSAQHGVFSQIRWHTDTPDVNGLSTFKINNNYSAFYARWFMQKYPEHNGFFRTRHQTSIEDGKTHDKELTPNDFPYTN